MGPPLFEALIGNSVLVWCVSTLEQRSWRRCLGKLKTGPPIWTANWNCVQVHYQYFCGYRQVDSRCHDNYKSSFLLRLNVCNDLAEAMKALDGKKKTGPPRRHPDSICWGSSFGPPCKRNVFIKGSESGPPWNQKVVPPCLRFEDQKRVPSLVILFCFNFHKLEALEACLAACLEACPWSILFEFPWPRDTGVRDLPLKPAFKLLFHLINFLFCGNFHQLEASRLALRPSLCASCGLKF